MSEPRRYVTLPIDTRRMVEPDWSDRLERAMFELFVTFHRMCGIEPSVDKIYVYSKEIERWNVTISLTIAEQDVTALFPNLYRLPQPQLEQWVRELSHA